jgi:hypothetical protein
VSGIVIENPEINHGVGDWITANPHVLESTYETFIENKVNPVRYPQAVAGCAGNGGLAWYLNIRHWSPRNLYCIDRKKPVHPQIWYANWLYWDIEMLAGSIVKGYRLPNEVFHHKGKFDLVGFRGDVGTVNEEEMQVVAGYLLRKGGFWITPIAHGFK